MKSAILQHPTATVLGLRTATHCTKNVKLCIQCVLVSKVSELRSHVQMASVDA
jgi:hypothetical protein